MRKHSISVLLVITIIFGAFTFGFFLGRNQKADTITVNVPKELVTVPIKVQETAPPVTEEPMVISFPISINEADKEEIMALPGIGEVLADRIIEFRNAHGDFSSPEELLNVEGVGKKRLEEIMDLITVGG